MPQTQKRLPEWFRRSLPSVRSAESTHEILDRYQLNTVCESALCPNRSECYANRTATFMILGNSCTRRCGFCAVPTGPGETLQADEPQRVAKAAKELGLQYVVITSVARDELEDEGSEHFGLTVGAVREAIENVEIEVLTPDFHARKELIANVTSRKPEVYNHNIETVRRLQRKVRAQSDYDRSLKVLKIVKDLDSEILTKSGLMLGLGETDKEVCETAEDLLEAGCDILTLGQYLSPGVEGYLPVDRYVSPQDFNEMAEKFKKLGFKEVFAGPYVRSSYHAGETFHEAK